MVSMLTGAGRAVLPAATVALALLPAAPAQAAPPTVTDTRFQQVSAVVEGPLEGGADGALFGALVDGFAFRDESGQPATAASTDFFFGTVECLTDTSDVALTVAPDLSGATLTGTVSGTCFDLATSRDSEFTATVSLEWAAAGPLETQRGARRDPEGGTVCRSVIRTREATATGTLSWSAPELGIGGTGSPVSAAPLLDRRDICRTPNPGR